MTMSERVDWFKREVKLVRPRTWVLVGAVAVYVILSNVAWGQGGGSGDSGKPGGLGRGLSRGAGIVGAVQVGYDVVKGVIVASDQVITAGVNNMDNGGMAGQSGRGTGGQVNGGGTGSAGGGITAGGPR